MALQPCKECGKQISDQAKKCPYCGIEIDKKDNSTLIFTIIVLLIMVSWFIASGKKPIEQNNQLYIKPIAATKEPSALLPIINTWEYDTYLDNISNKSIYSATIKSQNDYKLDFPYGDGNVTAQLVIRNHPKYGKEIIFFVSKGQLHCSYSDCRVNLRFDDGDVISLEVHKPDDSSSKVYFLTKPKTIISKILKSRKLHIQVTFFQEGSPTFEFNTENLKIENLK